MLESSRFRLRADRFYPSLAVGAVRLFELFCLRHGSSAAFEKISHGSLWQLVSTLAVSCRQRSYHAEETPLLNEETPLLNEETPLLNEKTPLLNEKTPLLNEEIPLLNEETPLLYEETPLLY